MFGGAAFGDVDVGGEGGAAEGVEGDFGDDVALDADGAGDAAGGVELDAVALAVLEGERVAGVAVAAGEGEAGGGVQTAREQAHGGSDGRGRMIHDCILPRGWAQLAASRG